MKPLSLCILLITLNERHNLTRVFENLAGFASKIIVVDSFSTDGTQKFARENGAVVKEKKFESFGSQWNYAISLPDITEEWVMKLDPDEELDDGLKSEIRRVVSRTEYNGYKIKRDLVFMGEQINVSDVVTRLWRRGTCTFTDTDVNEYPIIDGAVAELCEGVLKHHDSPNLHHWVNKQNIYTTIEAAAKIANKPLAFDASLFGDAIRRRMWVKQHFFKIPFRYPILFLYHYIYLGTFKKGSAGFHWAMLRVFVYWLYELKVRDSSKRKIELKTKGM